MSSLKQSLKRSTGFDFLFQVKYLANMYFLVVCWFESNY
jgi:hypothetical protein